MSDRKEVTIADAPSCLNTGDKAMWVLGYNECLAKCAAPATVGQGVPVLRDWKAIEAAIDEYLDGYELRLDEGCHTPTEFERFLIDDALAGLLAEEEVLALLAASPTPSSDAGLLDKGQQPVQVTTVAIVRHDDTDCPQLDWAVEGGISEVPDGAELFWASLPLTDDTGHGTIYRHPAPQAPQGDALLREFLGAAKRAGVTHLNATQPAQDEPWRAFDAWAKQYAAQHPDLDLMQYDVMAFASAAYRAALSAPPKAIELAGVAEANAEGGGRWATCSGCHELNEGHATGPFSKVMQCHLGGGCSECGGIGAIWDTTDYQAMADAALSIPPMEGDAAVDAAFEAVRRRLCELPRFNFVLDDDGVVRSVQGLAGDWIEFDAAHMLFDPVVIDAAIAAMGKGGEQS